MSIADQGKTPLELLADKVVNNGFAVRAVRFSQLNPEQQLAVMLEELVEHQKGHLALLNAILPLSQACVEWRKTPEGQAWAAKQAAKRAVAEAAQKSVPLRPGQHDPHIPFTQEDVRDYESKKTDK